MKKFAVLALCIVCCCHSIIAQTFLPFYFTNNVPVHNNQHQMKAPFAGGFSSPQFSDVDLNNDGIKDLFVFDRPRKKISTFINGGKNGLVDYTYAPGYETIFPKNLQNWVLFIDYNNDGLEDIFTYGVPGSIKLYKSFYENDSLKFILVNNILEYEGQAGFPINISVSPSDIPGIADVDVDGDLDVLNFDQSFGSNLEWFKNVSVEYNLPEDSLYFIKQETCWGNFLENAYNSDISLDACNGLQLNRENLSTNKHVGSTVLAFDYDDDSDTDLLLGDISSSRLNFLLNGGNPNDAHITETWQWLKENDTLDTYIYLSTFNLDINNDGLLDVICATNTTETSETKNQIDCYKNTSNSAETRYVHDNENFFTNDILDFGSNSYPAVVDYNNDGLMDIAVGVKYWFNRSDTSSYGMMAMLKNVGTGNKPAFELVDTNFSNLYNLRLFGIRPAFGDLDGDGDMDMITGDTRGFLHYFENIADSNEPMQLQLNQLNIDSISVGTEATPVLFDYNKDGLLDIIAGNRGGALYYLKNSSSNNQLKFEVVDNFFGRALVTDIGVLGGYSAPTVIIESITNTPYIIANNYSGNLYLFSDLYYEANDSIDAFTVNDSIFDNIKTAGTGGVAVHDFNNDGFLEMIIGNINGGLQFYSQNDLITSTTFHQQNEIKIYPNPVKNTLYVGNNIHPLNYQIFDFSGKLINQNKSLTNKLQVQHLQKGLYILKLQKNEKVSYHKFLKH